MAMIEVMRTMASRGWLVDRKLQAFNDYLRNRRLHADFLNFLKSIKR